MTAAVEADVLRIGFGIGYFTKADIARWADRQIAAVDAPSEGLIDLSMNQHIDPYDLLKLLDAVSQRDAERKVAAEIGFIGLLVASNRMTTGRAMRSLFAIAHSDGITDEQRSRIYHLDDDYDCALAGTYGTMAEVEHGLREFISTHTEQLVSTYPQLFNVLDS